MKDKVIVITGASGGIGAAAAAACAKNGARVVLLARREKELAEVAARCGNGALAIACDVTKRSDIERARDTVLAKLSQIDVWVNNAGRGITKAPSALTDEDVDEMILVNVKSVLYGMQAVLPHFKQRKKGQFINVSSMLGRLPLAAFRSAYSASKAAMNSLSASFRMELHAEFPDIHVTVVSPPVVATDFGSNAKHGGVDSRKFPGAQPVEEVAGVIVDAIERPRAEIYTRAGGREMVMGYYGAEDMGEAETKPPFMHGPPPQRP